MKIYVPDSTSTPVDIPEQALKLDYEAAMFHANLVVCYDCRVWQLLRIVFEDLPEQPDHGLTYCAVKRRSKAVQHLAGLIDLTLKLPVTILWQYPEQLLSPAQACNLGDLCIIIDKILQNNANL